MPDFVTKLVEYQQYQQFGFFNATVIAAVVIIAISLFQAWAMTHQIRRIWKGKSGEGLSVLWFSYTMWFFVAAIVYAFHTQSGTMFVNATVMMVGHLIILIGLWRFKSWTRNEIGQTLLYAAIPIVVAIVPSSIITSINMPGTDAAFMMFSFGTICAVATQPWEMWQNETAGIADPRYIGVNIVAVIFWTVYAFQIGAIALQILNPILLVLFMITLALCFKYRDPSEGTA